MADDVKTVKATGGVIRYAGSVVFSSTKLLHGNFTTQTPEVKSFCQSISQRYEPDELRSMVDSFSDLKVLVIGDIIFDEYETVQVQGLTSKNRILSGRRLYGNQQAGGALAVYRHALEFTEDVKFLSVIGKEPWTENEIRKFVSKDNDKIVRCGEFTSIRKLRFVEPYKDGVELNKLFSVNYINEAEISESAEGKVLDSLASMIQDFDLVLVMDFGHGLMTRKIRGIRSGESPFLSLNCQTNSYNHGYNVIDRQYYRADSFSLDESEIKLSCGIKKPDFTKELAKLKGVLGESALGLPGVRSRRLESEPTSKNHDALLSKRRSLTQSERVMHSVQSLHWRRQKDCQSTQALIWPKWLEPKLSES